MFTMMKYLQKLGKALMLPVACLPICGILMGIGYLMCPATMQGGDISGVIPMIGFFLVKAGGALIDNMALLFVIGVGVGMADDHDGTAGLAALASWLMITNLLSTGVVTTLMPAIADNQDKMIAFGKIANPFIGILAGIIGATCYNKFKSTKLPDWLSFFSGKRCVAIIAGVVSIIVSAILLFVWPLIFGLLIAAGNGIAGMGAVGAGIYAFLNRLLIPTGLHHALNNVFWFDTIGLGDLTNFWGGKTSADVTWDLGMYMSGFFPCMMFGIPGAALAMIKSAKSNKKKVAIGLLSSAALCAFICGVTEPFEFGFMFLAPGLYLVYALLYGIFTVITTLVGFRAGFSFSAGATDLFFSASLPAAKNTWMIIPLGIAAFVVFYVVFRFMIVKFDLKTPGREDDDVDETKVELANNDYTAIAATILEGLGGKDNVVSIDNCITRLRLEVKDNTAVDEKKIKSAGVAGVVRPGKTSVQVIIGTKVQFVADEFKKLCR
jgi:N-acetylglucosamine PTS system EIICBA or EIICB component